MNTELFKAEMGSINRRAATAMSLRAFYSPRVRESDAPAYVFQQATRIYPISGDVTPASAAPRPLISRAPLSAGLPDSCALPTGGTEKRLFQSASFELIVWSIGVINSWRRDGHSRRPVGPRICCS
jgi:hypothetical protein